MSVESAQHDGEIVIEPLTRELYDALVGTGKLDGVPVELLDGELVRMSPQGWPHRSTISRLARVLDRAMFEALGDSYWVEQEKPFAAGPVSEPEPDLAVVDADQILRGTDHPGTAHLIVEVSESSRRVDLVRKPPIYAAAGVPLYWVVDVTARQVIVHSRPVTHPTAGYDAVEVVSATGSLSVLGVTIAVPDFLA